MRYHFRRRLDGPGGNQTSACLLLPSLGLLLLAGCARQNVVVPTATTAADSVHFSVDAGEAIKSGRLDPGQHWMSVRGGSPPLSWLEGITMADPEGDGIYHVTIPFPPVTPDEQPVAYKFKIEGLEEENDGWEDGPNRYFVRRSGSQSVHRGFNEPQSPLPPTYTGDIRIHAAFESAHVPARDLLVYLPPGYESQPEREYPVVYLHDGQNIFDVRSVGAEWRVDETAERLIQSGAIDPFIAVGISNTPARIDEYTPTRARPRADLPEMGGGGDAYGRFIVDDVIPFIESTYRAEDGPANRTLGGSSLGGLISLYVGLNHPDVFGNLLAVSPSIWWDDRFIIRFIENLPTVTQQRIWLDMGTEEGARYVEQARALRDALHRKGWSDESIAFLVDEGAEHTEAAWARRVEGMLRFLFPRNDLDLESAE